MTHLQYLEAILGAVRDAQINTLDACEFIRESSAGPANQARLKLAHTTGHLSKATNLLHEAIAKREGTWCDGCGEGAPGVMFHIEKGDVPCPVCVAKG